MCPRTRLYEDQLAKDEDLDLAEADCGVVGAFGLHNEISARRHARGARQVDSSSLIHNTWILSAHVVVPQGGRRDCRWHVRQSNNEVVWAMCWTHKKAKSKTIWQKQTYVVTAQPVRWKILYSVTNVHSTNASREILTLPSSKVPFWWHILPPPIHYMVLWVHTSVFQMALHEFCPH